MKYELVSRSVTIKGKVFRKTEKVELDDQKINKVLLDTCYEAGFIKPKGTKAKNPAEAIAQYKSDKAKAEKKEADETKAKAEAKKEVKAKDK